MKVIFEKDEIKHITEKSFYDNNYYKILNCGDSLTNFENLVLYQHYDEMFNCFEYHFGVFDNNDKFISYIVWSDFDDTLEHEDKGE
jgi:hypothetical protein